jgi:hypothetical protein
VPKKPKRKAQPSDKLSPSSIAKLADHRLIAHLKKHFGPAKRQWQRELPYLLEAHRRYSQPGRTMPLPGKPFWGVFCKQQLGVDVRTVQRWIAEAEGRTPKKHQPDKYTAVDIAHLERVAYAAQKLADADPDNSEYEPIRKAIMEKPSGFDGLENKYYEGNKADGKHYYLTPDDMWNNLKKRYPGIWDCCPYPRKKGYDALKVPWHKTTYCNCPFLTTVENGKKIGFTAWCRKAISEQNKGKTTVMVFPMDFGFHLLLNAGAKFRSIGDVKWRATEDNTAQSSSRKIVEIVLRGKKAA